MLAGENLGYLDTAKKIEKYKTAVCNYLTRSKRAASTAKIGTPTILSEHAKLALMNCAKEPGMTARKVVAHTGVRASVRTVQRVLQDHPEINWEKPKVRPALIKLVIDLCFKWADKMWNTSEAFWPKALFTDEKQFTLDGPDSISNYWRDKRLPPSIFSERARGGGGLMV